MTIVEALQLLRVNEEISLRRTPSDRLVISVRNKNYGKTQEFDRRDFNFLLSFNSTEAIVESLVFDCLNDVREMEE